MKETDRERKGVKETDRQRAVTSEGEREWRDRQTERGQKVRTN